MRDFSFYDQEKHVQNIIETYRSYESINMYQRTIIKNALRDEKRIHLGGNQQKYRNGTIPLISEAFFSIILELNNVERIDASCTRLSILPEGTNRSKKLKVLLLSYTSLTELPKDICMFSGLEYLALTGTKIEELPNEIGYLENLTRLYLRETQIKKLPPTIRNLKKLEVLELNRSPICELPEDIDELVSLQRLYAKRTLITRLPKRIGGLQELSSLYLSNNDLTDLPVSITKLKSLTILNLSFCGIHELPKNIGDLKNLKTLSLNGTKISEIPESVSELRNLRHLLLCHCKLKEIHYSLFQLGLPFVSLDPTIDSSSLYLRNNRYVNIFGTILYTQPTSLFLKHKSLLRDYFESAKTAVNTTKVIILGQGGAGKTYTLMRLMNGGRKQKYNTTMTPGVDIKPYQAKVNGRGFTIHFWDFGGQEVMHSMHRCFLTERSCYLIIIDTRRADMDLMAQARYWLKNISSFASKTPVLIMVNLWDNTAFRGIDSERLHKEFDNYLDLRGIVAVSAKEATQEIFQHDLVDKILEMAGSMVSLDMQFPIKWHNIRKKLLELGKDHKNYYISQKEYYRLCEKNGVLDREIQIWLLDWFNDLGECFSYYKEGDRDSINEYKVLDPQWITNAIYILINRGYDYIDQQKNPGVLSRLRIEQMLFKAEGGTVKYINGYSSEECGYILKVMRKFELSYLFSQQEELEFIPALLPIKSPVDLRKNSYKQLVKYELRYMFLPDTVLQRLMVRCFDQLEKSKCWSKGLVLVDKIGKISTVLDMGGGDDILSIEVYADGKHPASDMLYWVLDQINVVNSKLSLRPEHFIVIGIDGEKAVEVEHLRNLKSRGNNEYAGYLHNYDIDALMGLTFGNAIIIAEKKVKENRLRHVDINDLFSFGPRVNSQINHAMGEKEMSTEIKYENCIINTGDVKDSNMATSGRIIDKRTTFDMDKFEQIITRLDATAKKQSFTEDEQNNYDTCVEVLKGEIVKPEPEKNIIKMAINGIKMLKGSAEFGAAVATLVNFLSLFNH